MMNRKIDEIVKDYYKDLTEAFKTGKLNLNKLHLAEDVLLLRPHEKFEGRQNVEKAMQDNLIPYFKRFELVHQFYDSTMACSIIDCVTKASATIPTAEWLKIRDGKIFEIHQFFDSTAWSRAMDHLR